VKNGVLGAAGVGYAAIGGRDASTTIHEWGHAFAWLGDEYDAPVYSHEDAVGRWPNVSATSDPETVPWKHWIEAKHPQVGVYEGAAQRAKGAWKPTSSGCAMASDEEFCPVCTEVLVLRIYSLVDPIDSCAPPEHTIEGEAPLVVGEEPLVLRVRTLKPATHALEVRWWMLPRHRAALSIPALAESRGEESEEDSLDDLSRKLGRGARGPLAPLDDKPTATSRSDDDGEHEFSIRAQDHAPGSYRVICRVVDTTKLRGERWPLVLEDELDLLQSERGWWIEIPAR